MNKVAITKIEPNKHKLGANVMKGAVKVAKAGILIDETVLQKLQDFKVNAVYIVDKESDDYIIDDIVDDEIYSKLKQSLQGTVNVDGLKDICKELTDRILTSSILDDQMSLIKKKSTHEDSLIDHSIGTAIYAGSIAAAAGFDRYAVNDFVTAGLLHDIGKTSIEDEILFAKTKLTEEQFATIRQHPTTGYEILKNYSWIKSTVRVGVLEHHENYDGSGYPRHLAGDNIHKIGTILHIADVFDALIRKRAYKQGWQPKDAYDYIKEQSGKMFCPKYATIFLNNIPIYETGTPVRLSDNSIAVVIHNVQNHILAPDVLQLVNKKIIRLSEESELEIKTIVR